MKLSNFFINFGKWLDVATEHDVEIAGFFFTLGMVTLLVLEGAALWTVQLVLQ